MRSADGVGDAGDRRMLIRAYSPASAGESIRASTALRALLLMAATVLGCAEGFQPLSNAPTPQDVRAAAVRVDAVRLTWTPSTAVNVVAYVVERRVDFSGTFVEAAQVPQTPLAQAIWIDTDVRPETVYGYRIVALTNVGDRSSASTIAGALTPPLPGIEVTTTSRVTTAEALDPDGYEIMIAGPDTVRASLGVSTKRRFSPLRPGTYAVTLNGLIARCSVQGGTRQVVVTDTTATTITPLAFDVTCRDPNRGEIAVVVNTTGANRDPSVTITVLGEAADTSLPPVERTYAGQSAATLAFPTTSFVNLRPGTYDVTIADVATNCTLSDAITRTVTVAPLAVAAVVFAVSCVGSTPPTGNLPFVLRNRWSPASAPNGTSVVLVSELDLSARTGQGLNGVQADYFYDPAVLRFDSTNVARLAQLTVNGNIPGQVTVLAASTTARTGVVKLFELAFTVIGSTGQDSPSATVGFRASNRVGTVTTQLGDSIRIEEDTFTVGTGAGVNAPPVAQVGGPYAGNVGTAVSLSASGSSDPDGSIASFVWAFGDNTTGSGATVSKTYAAVGTYTVTLTVTDDDGATASAQTTVTITAGSGGNLAPVAEANGPYAATVGVPLALSSAGSQDPDGTIVSRSWALGNGQSASGASPSVTYSSTGTFTITLTVTDNGGRTATDQATVVVAAAGGGNTLSWRSAFGAYVAANEWVPLTLSLDLANDLTETPGVEAVRTFVIDSVKWDPARFTLVSVNLGAGITGSVNQSAASAGRLSAAGSVAEAQQTGDAFRVLTFMTIRLRPVSGQPGTTTSTATFLGPIQGPASTVFFVYNPRITVIEGSFVLP